MVYEANWTKPMGALLATTQGIINDERLTAAQKIDAANTSHLVLFNMLTGAMGNAPTPHDANLLGWSQSGIGLLAPLGGNLPHDGSYFDHVFDTSRTNDALETNSADNNVQLHHMQAVVTQGALNSGLLKPEMLDPGIVVNGKIVEGAQFDTWYETRGNLLSLGPPAPPGTDAEHYKVPSLDDYVDAVLNPLELHR